MKHIIIQNDHKYGKSSYEQEQELTETFSKYYKEIISEKSIFIPLGKKLTTNNFKDSISDGFLLVWETPSTPFLYITEIELERHSIDKHILPQLGDFISFIQGFSDEDCMKLGKFIHQTLKNNGEVFKQIQEDTEREVYELVHNALEDLQVLLVIDRMKPELSTGLSYIEKAINLKIRTIEVTKYLSEENTEIIQYIDNEGIEKFGKKKKNDIEEMEEEYFIQYHLEDKPEQIQSLFTTFLAKIPGHIKVTPTKHYIGYFKNNSMIFSSVIRKKNIIFYSIANIKTMDKEYTNISFRDVTNIGHYTNRLPTEIIIAEDTQLDDLIDYFSTVEKIY